MGWSSRIFLLSTADTVFRLSSNAYTRMLGADTRCSLPDFACRRVRMASVTVELAHGIPLGVRHLSFSILDFDEHGVLDVQRLNAQQVARLDNMLADVLGSASRNEQILEASSRFVARGGQWSPAPSLRRRIEAAALGTVPCRRVRVLG